MRLHLRKWDIIQRLRQTQVKIMTSQGTDSTRRWANRIRDAYTLNEAESLLNELIAIERRKAAIEELESLRGKDQYLCNIGKNQVVSKTQYRRWISGRLATLSQEDNG